MKQESLGDVIVLEAAPEGLEGGNTRVSGNIVFIPDTVEGALAYQTDLNGPFVVEEELMKAWAEMICENKDWVEDLGCEMKPIAACSPEFSEAEAGDTVKVYCVDGHLGDASLWNVLKEQEEDLGYQVMYGTRATSLIRKPETNEALGAIAETEDGTTLTIKARKGVVLSCGGFENNPEMVRNYYHNNVFKTQFYGNPYNRGDGFGLVGPFGAQLWHMNSFSGGHTNQMIFPEGYTVGSAPAGSGWIMVGENSKRYMYEEVNGQHRHGKLRMNGVWSDCLAPGTIHQILGAKAFEESESFFPDSAMQYANTYDLYDPACGPQEWVDKGVVTKADTIEELAEKLGRDPEALAETVNQYNQYCADGVDPDFHRGEAYYEFGKMDYSTKREDENISGVLTEMIEAIKPFDLEPLEPPFYAIECCASFINTQGGPKRNGQAQILDTNDEPIPRLYGAGEFGSIYSYVYNGGGNVSEAIATGRVAARSAAANEPWDADGSK